MVTTTTHSRKCVTAVCTWAKNIVEHIRGDFPDQQENSIDWDCVRLCVCAKCPIVQKRTRIFCVQLAVCSAHFILLTHTYGLNIMIWLWFMHVGVNAGSRVVRSMLSEDKQGASDEWKAEDVTALMKITSRCVFACLMDTKSESL